MITQNEGGIVIESDDLKVIAPSWEAIAALNAAHAAALDEVHQVANDAKHLKQGWEYASFDAIANVLRPVLAKQGLAIAVTVSECVTEARGTGAESMTTMVARLILTHAKGAMRITRHVAYGQDWSDKGPNKALTVALKYGVMRTFMMSTGEVHDEDEDDAKVKNKATGAKAETAKPEPSTPKPAATVVTPPTTTGAGGHADWTKSATEREAFKAWREKLTLSDSECKRLAAAYGGKTEPLKLFAEFNGTRLELQNAIEAQMAREQAVADPEPSQLTM